MVDTVKGSGQVLQNSGLRRVTQTEGLEELVIVGQVLHQLLSDETFKKLGSD